MLLTLLHICEAQSGQLRGFTEVDGIANFLLVYFLIEVFHTCNGYKATQYLQQR